MSGKWLVTGANGYLGGEVCRGLQKEDYDVCALARPGHTLDSLEKCGVTCHSYDALPGLMAEGDVFVHCAGKVCDTGLWDDYQQINVDWTLSLYEQAIQRGARCFVYVSSVAALGYSKRQSDIDLDESDEPLLTTGELYGRSKLLAEQALQQRSRTAQTRLVILRPGFIYGRRPLAPSQRWLRRGSIVDPNQRVPLVHVDNFLSALTRTGKDTNASGIFLFVDDEQPMLGELNALKLEYGILPDP
ncbi:MAG: NAD(P)-dependent oxidoreductase, partial [Candidatus Hydrogenedentes bacterium]|nr:NAD(P)-dependent oxidoreductase [Candidatus Hydrogenedentota bacterium]